MKSVLIMAGREPQPAWCLVNELHILVSVTETLLYKSSRVFFGSPCSHVEATKLYIAVGTMEQLSHVDS